MDAEIRGAMMDAALLSIGLILAFAVLVLAGVALDKR
jgi:hypothetical protein